MKPIALKSDISVSELLELVDCGKKICVVDFENNIIIDVLDELSISDLLKHLSPNSKSIFIQCD